MFKAVICVILAIIVPTIGFAQDKTLDSLKLELRNAKHDTIKCRILDLLTEIASDEEWPIFNSQLKTLTELKLKTITKSSPEYKVYLKCLANATNNTGVIAQQNNELRNAIDYFKSSLKLMQELNDKAGIASTYNNLGRMYERLGKKTEGLDYYIKCLKAKEELNDKFGMAHALLNIGSVYRNYGETDKSLDYYFKSLKLQEEINDKAGIANSFNAIGVTFYELGNIISALDYYHKSLIIHEEIKDSVGISNALNNIGLVYYNQSDSKKALEYYTKSLSIEESIRDKEGVAYSLNNIGFLFYHQGENGKAMEYFTKSLKIREEMLDKSGIASCYVNIGLVYRAQKNYAAAIECFKKALSLQEEIKDKLGSTRALTNIGGIYFLQKNYTKALVFCKQGLKLSRELGYPEEIKIAAKNLMGIYKVIGDYRNAFEVFEIFIQMRDSIENEDTRKASIKSQFRYTYEKKAVEDSVSHAKESEIKNLALKQQASELKAKRNQQYALYGGLVLVIVFAGFMYNRFKVTQNQKQIIEIKEKETQKQNKIIIHQKLLVEEKQKEILDSINYAKRIQYTLLAHEDFLKENIPENFVFFHPKDIVSGDFYWATKKNNKFYLAVCDSTGHGVPGAFMSLLNTNFLNEAINEKGIEKPNDVFNYVRQRLIDNISKDGQQDGFDGILLCLDKKTNTLSYAAANNSPVLILNNEIVTLQSDRMPVGVGERKEDFKLYSIDIKQGDTLYLYTDGYADQFGGPKGKKFKYKPLNQLLLSNNNQPLCKQKEIIESEFKKWKGNLEQVDDVCVIGIKVT